MGTSSPDNPSQPDEPGGTEESGGTAQPAHQSPGDSTIGNSPRANLARRLLKQWRLLLLVLAVVVAGTLIARRANQTPSTTATVKTEEEKKDPNAPKEPFKFGGFTIRPSNTDRIETGIKPGHWTTASQPITANFDNFYGDLAADILARSGENVVLDGLPFRLRTERPVVLPKAQKKTLDIPLFRPIESNGRQVAPRLVAHSGREVWSAREIMSLLPAEQFFFVALAAKPDDYRYLQSLDTTWAPQGDFDDRGQQAHYRVLLPVMGPTMPAPLPSNMLFWTSTAVVLWDSLDPAMLTPEQQQAVVDWLNWGGQLIVSGPGSLELLRDSFLDGFLPAGAGESWALTAAQLAPLSKLSGDDARPLHVAGTWTGLHLLTTDRAAEVVAETPEHQPLLVERRVGRGRIAVSAFRLTQRDLVNWPGYDALFNAALLRRQARQFDIGPAGKVGVAWADKHENDPLRNSQVRIFSRDAGRPPWKPPDPTTMLRQNFYVGATPSPDDLTYEDALTAARSGPGVAGWNDESDVSDAARDVLKAAAGIGVPRIQFVLTVLVAYIAALVPLNWLISRALGRVEAAWLAAPVIAIVFAVLVARLAQLDIGFARSRTEVAVLEVQGDYPRAHLTRYCALYTSLTTDYDVALENPVSVAIPFRINTGSADRQSRSTVTLRLAPDAGSGGEPAVQLADFEVSSNSTGMIHSEEMFDLGGSLELVRVDQSSDKYRLRNGTKLRIENAEVYEARDGVRKKAQLGMLDPGATLEFTLVTLIVKPEPPRQTEAPDAPDETEPSAPVPANPFGDTTTPPAGEVGTNTATTRDAPNVARLRDAAGKYLTQGELSLVGEVYDELPGMTIRPVANQSRHGAIVVAHLKYDPLPPPEIDRNSRASTAVAQPTEPE